MRVRFPHGPLPLNERGLMSTMNDEWFYDMAETAENYYQQCADTWRDRSDALGDELDGVFE